MPHSVDKGGRVTALLSANSQEIVLLGHGVYEGDQIVPDNAWPFPNPCIKLDDGRTVWGFQCWWGPEGKTLERLSVRYPKAIIREHKDELPVQ